MKELIISYPRAMPEHKGSFRIREDIDKPGIFVYAISGESIMVRTDNENGRLYIMADIEVSEYLGKPYVIFTAEYNTELMIPEGAELVKGMDYCRMCFRRQKQDWRVRNEKTGEINFVKTYRGVIKHDWFDRTAHLYHIGETYLYKGDAILVPGEGTRPEAVQTVIDKYSKEFE